MKSERRVVSESIGSPCNIAAAANSPPLWHFTLNPLGKASGFDHAQLMRAAGDLFVLVVGFDLERDERPIGVDHPCATHDPCPEWRRRYMRRRRQIFNATTKSSNLLDLTCIAN